MQNNRDRAFRGWARAPLKKRIWSSTRPARPNPPQKPSIYFSSFFFSGLVRRASARALLMPAFFVISPLLSPCGLSRASPLVHVRTPETQFSPRERETVTGGVGDRNNPGTQTLKDPSMPPQIHYAIANDDDDDDARARARRGSATSNRHCHLWRGPRLV